MGEHDRQNLEFIMSLHHDDIEIWLSKISEEEQKYAKELLASFEEELNGAEHMLAVSEIIPEDLTAASSVLKKFMLNPKT